MNTTAGGTYSFVDRQPARALNYYRLKTVDKDGTTDYSTVRTVNNTGRFEVSLYPNPAGNVLSLKIESEKKANLQVQIVDAEGKVLLTQLLNSEAGSTLKTIKVSALKSGNYFMKMTSATEQWVIAFEKIVECKDGAY